MRKIKVLVAFLVGFTLFSGIRMITYAEEFPTEEVPTEEIVEPTEEEFISSELGSYFEEEVKPYLLDAGISLMGFIGSCLTLLMAVRKFLNAHKDDIDTTLNLAKELLESEVKELRDELQKIKEENEGLVKENARLYEDASKVSLINDDITKLKNCFKIIAINDPKLVSNGQAKYIAEELGTNEENNKEQVSI